MFVKFGGVKQTSARVVLLKLNEKQVSPSMDDNVTCILFLFSQYCTLLLKPFFLCEVQDLCPPTPPGWLAMICF